jgi:hypothetical protein
MKAEYFRKALSGDFEEAGRQAIDLGEEDPSIFGFIVAFLYEGTYIPIRPVADVLGWRILHPRQRFINSYTSRSTG